MYPHPAKTYMGIFVKEQVDSLRALGLNVDVLFINGPASRVNYFRGVFPFWSHVMRRRYDLIHAHYIYPGVIARLQVGCPVVVTFHSGEFYTGPLEYLLSNFIAPRVAGVILVSPRLKIFLTRQDTRVIPCGVDTHRFRPMPRQEARQSLGMPTDKKLVLFAANKRPEKRFDLVESAMNSLKTQMPDLDLITVTQEPPERIPLYMNACDALVLVSDKEGSPQVVKEAMACNLPIVAVPAGDVPELISNIDGCYLCSQDPGDIAAKLKTALERGGRTNGAEYAKRLSLERIAQRIMEVYTEVGLGEKLSPVPDKQRNVKTETQN
jgi:glycosyltransferase involved in cell wall biosynthesis